MMMVMAQIMALTEKKKVKKGLFREKKNYKLISRREEFLTQIAKERTPSVILI